MVKTNAILATLVIFFASVGNVQAQTPNGVHVKLPGTGATIVQSTAMSGTLSSRGITATWDVQSNSATITFVGTYATEWVSPNIDLYWFSTPADLPMSVVVTSTNASAYDFSAPYNTGSWNYTHAQNGLTGDLDFGTYFPASSRVDVEVNPNVEGAPYDITIVMSWGTGVADKMDSWGNIKALYR